MGPRGLSSQSDHRTGVSLHRVFLFKDLFQRVKWDVDNAQLLPRVVTGTQTRTGHEPQTFCSERYPVHHYFIAGFENCWCQLWKIPCSNDVSTTFLVKSNTQSVREWWKSRIALPYFKWALTSFFFANFERRLLLFAFFSRKNKSKETLVQSASNSVKVDIA